MKDVADAVLWLTSVLGAFLLISGCCGHSTNDERSGSRLHNLRNCSTDDECFYKVVLSDICRNRTQVEYIFRQSNMCRIKVNCHQNQLPVDVNCTRRSDCDENVNTTSTNETKCECKHGRYEGVCESQCSCGNNSSSDTVNGNCSCLDGRTRITCERVCPGLNGTGYLQQYICFEGGALRCGEQNGSYCEELCPVVTFGLDCQQMCDCDKICVPTNGIWLCQEGGNGTNSTIDTGVTQPTGKNQTYAFDPLHLGILVGLGIFLLGTFIFVVIICRKNQGPKQMTRQQTESSLRIVHDELPPITSQPETAGEKNKRFSSVGSQKRRKGVLTLPPRIKSTPPVSFLRFNQYDSTDDSQDLGMHMNELHGESYGNLKKESLAIQATGTDCDTLNKYQTMSHLQNYEICVNSSDFPEDMSTAAKTKKRSILGSMKKFVLRESVRGSRRHNGDPEDTQLGRSSFMTFQKPN